jgi:hypothetical protein
MYVCMYVCKLHICMYVMNEMDGGRVASCICVRVCMYVCKLHICMYVMNGCMMAESRAAYMYVCICIIRMVSKCVKTKSNVGIF